MKVDVVFYKTEMGNVPVKEFLLSLEEKDKKTETKMLSRLDLLERLGPDIRRPHAEKVRKDLFELKLEVNTNIFRILYFWCDGKAVCVHGFQKKDQKIKEADIDIAYKRIADYRARKDGILYVRSDF